MKKKTRDLKKHYREVERELRDFDIDLSEESWYRMWHTHLDWYGITNVSEKHRKIHIQYYLKIMEKIETQTRDNKRLFQTWIYLDGYEGTCDAIYFHTENPEDDFPYWLDIIKWNKKIPQILIGLLDLSKFDIGILHNERDNVDSYIIQKKGLGLEISKQKNGI
jgi:hypothetical protein